MKTSMNRTTRFRNIPSVLSALLFIICPAPVESAEDGLTENEAREAIERLATEARAADAEKESDNGLVATPLPSLREMLTPQEDGPARLEMVVRRIEVDGFVTPYAVLRKDSGDPGPEETLHPLFICMHGGGGNSDVDGPHAWPVNSREFQTQMQFAISLYGPQGIYFVPRMADDRRGRWWHSHVSKTFDMVIDHAIQHWKADPDRIYLVGISEGGFGSAILGPWMADRLAGANSMAAGVGLANPPANLRNVAFRTDVGERDTMFDRVGLARAFHEELDRLRAEDGDDGAYRHFIGVQPGRGHGIDYRPGIEWINGFKRDPWPRSVVWIDQSLDGRWRDRFYWLARPERPEGEDRDSRLVAWIEPDTNTIHIEAHRLAARNTDDNRTHGMDDVGGSERLPWGDEPVELLLHDELIDLDSPLTVVVNGETVFEGGVERSLDVIKRAFNSRPDPRQTPTASLQVTPP